MTALFALTSPPLTVALSDGPAFTAMALVAAVLAAASIVARDRAGADGVPAARSPRAARRARW